VSLGEPSARTAEEVVARAAGAASLGVLDAAVADCFACPRLVAWREEVAAIKRASFREQDYWGRPVPGFGPADAEIAILGLAPAAHGGNRTGRIFTGDRSGDVLFAALHRAGLANQPTSVAADDGLAVRHLRIFAAVRCAPPDNKPLPDERDRCFPFLVREIDALTRLTVIVVLGGFAYEAAWRVLAAGGHALPRPRPRFAHGLEVGVGSLTVLGCYHPSQQNTFTGRLTEPMLDAVLTRACDLAGG